MLLNLGQLIVPSAVRKSVPLLYEMIFKIINFAYFHLDRPNLG